MRIAVAPIAFALLIVGCASTPCDSCDWSGFAAAFGSSVGDANFDPDFDFDGDGNIGGSDHEIFLHRCSAPR